MLCGIAMMGLSACSDFFEPENNTMLKGDDYIKEASEMYAGFLGCLLYTSPSPRDTR